jgi:hypothetical protein
VLIAGVASEFVIWRGDRWIVPEPGGPGQADVAAANAFRLSVCAPPPRVADA